MLNSQQNSQQLNEFGEPLKYSKFGQIETSFDYFELQPELSDDEKKALRKEKRVKQRNLFVPVQAVTTPRGCLTGDAAMEYLKEQGIEEVEPADLLTDLPF